MKTTFQFLKKVKANNNREWFQENKPLYDSALEEMKSFMGEVLAEMEKHDQIEGKGKLFRIYRDVRFSKDKSPYKSNWSGSFKRATNSLRGGYYFRIEPGNTMIAGGFFNPNSADLLHIRKQISIDPDPLRKVLNQKAFKTYFGELRGEQVKTTPKGFDKEDPALDLLKFKQFIVRHQFTDKEVLDPGFARQLAKGFQKMRPYFDYMTDILITDLNGLSRVD